MLLYGLTAVLYSVVCFGITLFPDILTLFQVDSFAISRDSDMHEATRRVLSVLLRQVKLDSHCFTVILKTNL